MPGCKVGDLAIFYEEASPDNGNNGALMEVLAPDQILSFLDGRQWWVATNLSPGRYFHFDGTRSDTAPGETGSAQDSCLFPLRGKPASEVLEEAKSKPVGVPA